MVQLQMLKVFLCWIIYGAYKTYKVGLHGKWLYHNSKETSNTDSEKQEVLFQAVQVLGFLPQY